MRIGRLPRPVALAAAGLALLNACSASFDEPPNPTGPAAVPFELVLASGRAERSLTASLGIRRNGADTTLDGVTLSAVPTTAAQLAGDGTVTFLEAGRVRLIATSGTSVDTLVVDVAVPPTIVFDRQEGSGHRIYSVTLDGRALTRLTNGTTDDQSPTVGGGRVIYASFGAGQSDLRSVSLTGGASSAITSTPTIFETEPSLSANGAQLAYVRSTVTDGVPKLWVAAADGTNAHAAAPAFGTVGSADAAPHWTADGSRLAFVSTAAGTSQLYVYDRQSGTVSPLGVGAGPNVAPAWNAAGTALAFSSARSGAPGLYQTDTKATGAVWLARGSESEPAWTVDGRIVFTHYVDGIGRLRWLDPAEPSIVHDIDTGAASAAHPVVVP